LRQQWRELDYWHWLWRQRTPGVAKLVIVGVVLAAVLIGGWFVADGLTAAKAGTGADSVVLETTTNRLITVRAKGKLVTKVVPVVKRVVRVQSHTQTQLDDQTDLRYSTRVVTEPGGARVVQRVVTTRVPVVKNHVVTINGKTKTLAVTNSVPTTKTETQVRTQRQTVTDTQTAPGGTITQTSVQDHTTTATTTQVVPTTIPTTVEVTTTVVSTDIVTTILTTTVINTETVTETVTTTVPLPPAPVPPGARAGL
jgi:hypothetical protein